jgi:Fic family protein
MLLLRAEGVASSNIEGFRMPMVDVAAAEVGGTNDPTARHIADNLAAVVDALQSSRRTLSIADLHEWHRQLMSTNSHLDPHLIGMFRDSQSWIGGTSPRDAALVPPPPDRLPDLMNDLLDFINADDLDPITQAAVAHAQFETIHPYGDGNGRIGRILIGWLLARRLEVDVPPPVSVLIARDPGGYLAGLTLFRMGSLDPWVEWMADKILRTGEAETALEARAEDLFRAWLHRLSGSRADATSRRVIAILGEHPVISSDVVATRLGVSERAGRRALQALAAHEIVHPYATRGQRGRPRNFWVATELLSLVSDLPAT